MSDKFIADLRTPLNAEELDPFSFNQGEKGQDKTGIKFDIDPYSYNQGNSNKSIENGSESGKNPWLPDIHLDGADNNNKNHSKPENAAIERDAQNRICKITYPGENKIREFGRDAAGNLNSVVSEDGNGESRLVKENGSWFADINGRKLALPGNVELSTNGDYALPLDAKTYKIEKSDGTVNIEKTNACGARVSTDKDGKIERITRKDGSAAEARFDKGNLAGIVESTPDGKQTNWQRQGDVWTSDSQPPQQRLNLTLQENGNTPFTGTDGFQHIIRGEGNELVQGPGKGKYSFDNQGRIQSIEYTDGKTVRNFGYDSDGNALNKITVEDKVKHKTTAYTRQGNTDAWTMTDAVGKKIGTWKGKASISCDGIYSEKTLGAKTPPQDDDNKPDNDGQNNDNHRHHDSEPAWMDWNWKGWSDFGKHTDSTAEKQQSDSLDSACNDLELGDESNNNCSSKNNDGKDEQNDNGKDELNDDGKDELNDDGKDELNDDGKDKQNDEGKDELNDDRKDELNDDGKDEQDDDGKDEQSDDGKDEQSDDGPDCPSNDGQDGQKDDDGQNNDGRDDQDDEAQNWESHGEQNAGVWYSFSPDGSESLERVTTDGAKSLFDKSGRLSSIHRTDGSTVDTVYKGRNLTQVIESNPKSGERVTWSRQAKGDWTSDSPKHPELRRNFKFNSDGDMSFVNADGVTHSVSLDGIVSDDRTPISDRIKDKSKDAPAPFQKSESVLDRRALNYKSAAGLPYKDEYRAPGITRDGHGLIADIVYPGGKRSTSLERDNSGNLCAVVSRDEKGAQRFERQGDKWYCDVDGMKLALPGQIKVSAQGDVSTDWGSGVWQTDKTDGTSINEKTNASGSRIALDKQGSVESISRKDGSSLQAHYQGAFMTELCEAGPDGKNPSNWKRQGDVWVSDTQPSQQRLNLVVSENGNLSFTGSDGLNHIRRGNGQELVERPGKAKFSFDTQGRISSIDYVGGKKNSFTYVGDSAKLKSISLDDVHNKTRTYTRDGEGDAWTISNASGKKIGTWKGEAIITDDGTYSNRRSGKSSGRDPVEFNNNDDEGNSSSKYWNSLRTDGQLVHEQISSDGSRASFDRNGRTVSIQRSNGSGAEAIYDHGKLSKLIETETKTGQKSTWTQQPDKTWTSDAGKSSEPRRDLSLNKNGELTYSNGKGDIVVEHLDCTKQVTQKDGTKLDFDKDRQIIKSTKGDLERTFTRDAGGIAVVRDRNLSTKEEKTIFERRPPAEENRSNIFVSGTGDLSYQNPDGTAVIERSNMLHLDLDKDGEITRAVGPHLTRTFQYTGDAEHKAVLSVTDTKMTEKGAKSQTWTRVANPDGTLSNEFASTDDKGKERKSRYSITPCADGEYEFRLAVDKPGDKPHVARIGGDGANGGFSDSVDDARDRLQEMIESHLDEPRKARFAAMLKSFEQRAADRVEAETAGGKSQDKAQSEWDQKVTHTYDYLAHMLDENPAKPVYDLNTRAKLVEDAVYSMAWPAKADDQGDWGCCWQISSVFLGVVQHPDMMAKMLDQLSSSGTFTDTKGKTWTPPKSLLRFTDEGGSWTIQNCTTDGGTNRSPCSEIWTSVAAYLSEDGRRTDRGAGGGDVDASNHALKLITGETWRDTEQSNITSKEYKRDLLLKGGVLLDMPGHMYLGTLQKNKGEWQIISSLQHGDDGREVNGIVNDLKNWVVHRVHTIYRPDIPKIPGIHDKPINRNSN